MQNRVYRVSEVSRHAFHHLVALWVMIFCLTFIVAFIMSMKEAKADAFLPFPKAEKIFEPAVLRNFSSSPSPALVDERCDSYLHPLHQRNASITSSSRNQRNAETKGVQTIAAIKAYRQCVSQIALEQLANR